MVIKLKEILKEYKQVGILYHYTTFMSVLQILKDDKLKAGETSDSTLKNRLYAVSFTRNKKFHEHTGRSVSFKESAFGNAPQVRITFDGNKLSDKYKINPWSQQGPFSKNKKGYESEERIVKSEPFFIPVKKYIISVDIIIDYESLKNKRDIQSQIQYDDYLLHYMPLRAKIMEFSIANNISINVIVDKNGNEMSDKDKFPFIKKIMGWWNKKRD